MDLHPLYPEEVEILLWGVGVIRGDHEEPIIAQRALGPADGERLSVKETHVQQGGRSALWVSTPP